MKYSIIMSMGLFVVSCNAAASSSEQGSPVVSRVVPITLMHGERTFTSHVDLMRKDNTGRSMVEHLKYDLPPVWALVHCRSATASTGVRRKLLNATEIHKNVSHYNQTHKKNPLVRDPHWYMIWQDATGALMGRFLGREKKLHFSVHCYRDLDCMLNEQKLAPRALAALRQYMEGNLYNEAVDWYRRVLECSRGGRDLIAANDPCMDWWLTIHDVGYTCFHNGEYKKALEMGRQSFRFNQNKEMELATVGLLCRAHVALEQWDKAIDIASDVKQPVAWRVKHDAGVFKALAEAYEHKVSLREAFYACAQAINVEEEPRSHLEFPMSSIHEEYAPACMHLMYYYAVQKDELGQLLPDVKDRLTIAATAVKRIPELLAQVNKDSEEHLREFESDVQAYQTRYPGRYEIALQEADRLLAELVPVATDSPAPAASSSE